MLAEKIDDLTCEACELNFMLDYYLETGQFEEAYKRAQPLITRQVTCYEANLRAYMKLAYYACKAGKPEIAADMCAYFMTHPDRGWEYAERCIPWSLNTNMQKKYRFSCDMVEALSYESREEVSLSLPEEFPLYRADGIYSVAALRDYFYKQATQLASLYDTRNGNNGYQERLFNVNLIGNL